MTTIAQYYNSARKHFIIHQGLFVISPIYALINFIIQYSTNSKPDMEIYGFIFYIIITAIIFGIGFTFTIMLLVYRKQKILDFSEIFQNEFSYLENSVAVIISFYVLRHGKTPHIDNPIYFNKYLPRIAKSFGFEYSAIEEEKMTEVLQYAKAIINYKTN